MDERAGRGSTSKGLSAATENKYLAEIASLTKKLKKLKKSTKTAKSGAEDTPAEGVRAPLEGAFTQVDGEQQQHELKKMMAQLKV